MIELIDICKKYENGIHALHNINIQFSAGHAYSVYGPSGSGKSTLLQILAGLIQPTSGLIRGLKEKKVSMVFQQDLLLDHLSAFENIRYGWPGKMNGLMEEKIKTIAGLCQCESYLDQKTGSLSGGQRQRVALARALLKEPDLLLMDEPFSQLDAALRFKLINLLRQLQRQLGFTLLFISHDFNDAINCADELVFLYQGRIRQKGNWRELISYPADTTVARFLTYPGMNLFKEPDGSWFGFYPAAADQVPLKNGYPMELTHMEGSEIWNGRTLSLYQTNLGPVYLLSDQPEFPDTIWISQQNIFRFRADGSRMTKKAQD